MLTSCVETTYALTHNGYGRLSIAGSAVRHHRIAYCKAHNIPLSAIAGKIVMHVCDNRKCINPDHLILGDHKQNMADMAAKGRTNTRRGSTHSKAKLTEQQVHEIKSTFGLSQRELAAKYGVSASLIAAIKLGKAWTHVV